MRFCGRGSGGTLVDGILNSDVETLSSGIFGSNGKLVSVALSPNEINLRGVCPRW